MPGEEHHNYGVHHKPAQTLHAHARQGIYFEDFHIPAAALLFNTA
jgi:hypothetical protein